MPTPAVAGLKLLPLTPVPLYVPLAGLPPVNEYAGAFIQTDELAGQLTVGSAFTVIVNVHVLVQPPFV